MIAVARVELSHAADADLVAILEYGAEMFGWDRAEAYVESFAASFTMLADHPEIGAVHPDIRPPVRSLPHGSHRIFYDIADEFIVVQRILHKSMDAQRWLG